MRIIGISVLFLSVLAIECSAAQDISGMIIIKKRLTHRNVTPSVSVYQRGASIKLGKNVDDDPIAYERSRVVVYLEGNGGIPDTPISSTPIEIKQINRQFVPDLVVVPVGAIVSFPNMDPIFHDVYSLSKAKSFDLGAYDKGQTRRVSFTKPGIVEAYCHLHPNMAATIVVMADRHYAQPDRNGQYNIPNVPPGHYTLVAWHKTAGYFRRSIDVGPDKTTEVDFLIPLDVDGKEETAKVHDLVHGAGSR